MQQRHILNDYWNGLRLFLEKQKELMKAENNDYIEGNLTTTL